MAEMLALKPKDKQNLHEYCFEKLSLVRKMHLNITASDKMNLLIGSLDNQNAKFNRPLEVGSIFTSL